MAEFVNKVKKNDVEYEIRDARIPEADVADAGKVLKVADAGGWELGEAGGGGVTLYKHFLQNQSYTMGITFVSTVATPLSAEHEEAFDARIAPAWNSSGAYNISLGGGGPARGVYVNEIISSEGSLAFNQVSYPFSEVTDTVTAL